MDPTAGSAGRRPAATLDRGAGAAAVVILLALAFLVVHVAKEATQPSVPGASVPVLVLLVVVAAATYKVVLRWDVMLAAILVVIFLVPIKRYDLPGNLPFNLEPYRVAIALVAVAWGASLLIDPRVRLRAGGLEPPVLLFVLTALVSVALNVDRLGSLGLTTYVVKTLTFFASFFALFYLIVSVVRTRAALDRLVRLLVAAGTFVAVAALVEARTQFNVFNHLHHVLPMLHFTDPRVTAGLSEVYLERSGGIRAYASSAHPIELSAVLMMLVPPAAYLLRRTGQRRWLAAALLLVLGALATLSRTGVVMLVVIAVVSLCLRPRQTARLWPYVLPALMVVYVALPNTLGSFYASFFPADGLVAQQTARVSGNHAGGDGRLADIGPALREASHRPLFGSGFGSRVTSRTATDTPGLHRVRILDDQWLSSLLEVGIVGVAALLWLLVRAIRRLGRVARSDHGDDGSLAVALAASITAFAVGMLTFDALGFVQVTILLFVLLALGSVLQQLRAARPAG